MSDDDGARERAEQRTLLVPRREQGTDLKRGHALQEFVVEKVLGVGGSSIVYMAQDTKLGRRVAVKEYLPGTIAVRVPSGEVVPRLPRFAEAYEKGLQSFINEARLLGSFDHPSLVKVYRFWTDNGTAYMAMPYYDGITLKKWMTDLGAQPSERWLRQLAESLMQALAVLHDNGCVHRDVAPDNILMLYDKAGGNYLEQMPRPVLLDFGAARRVQAEATQNLTALLKSGYSPAEQYGNDDALRQGPWTDVYALCAVLYAAAIGKVPNAAIARVVRDDLVPARVAGRGRLSAVFLAAIDAGLAVRPEHRPQSMPALLAVFNRAEPAPSLAPAVAAVDLSLEPAAPVNRQRKLPWVPWAWGLLGGAVLAVALLAAVWAVRR